MVALDSQFHVAISEACGNAISKEITSQIIPGFQEGNKAVIYVSEQASETLHDHQEILAGLMARDPKAAEEAMRRHIARVRGLIQSIALSEKKP